MLHIPKVWAYKSPLLLNVLEIAPLRNKEIYEPFSTATSDDFWQKCCFVTQNMLIKNSFKVCDCVQRVRKMLWFLPSETKNWLYRQNWVAPQATSLSLTECGNHPLNTLSWCVVKNIQKSSVFCLSYEKIITSVSKI